MNQALSRRAGLQGATSKTLLSISGLTTLMLVNWPFSSVPGQGVFPAAWSISHNAMKS